MNELPFFVAGINYKKTDVSVRGSFAINSDQYKLLLKEALQKGIQDLMVISTCNRTEIYGRAESVNELLNLLCSKTKGTKEKFYQLAYIKSNEKAVEHLFDVGAGLDSQILGDYEIIGQIKQAYKIAKEQSCIDTYLDRLVNAVIQASKSIKNNTFLSGGTVSVSFAAIQFLKEHVIDIKDKKILLLGTGKIGRNTCKNVVDYLGNTNITLINRTTEKAEELAQELNLKTGSYALIDAEIQQADIIIVATNAEKPIITKQMLSEHSNKVLIDLSIPNNIHPNCSEIKGVTLVNVDDLSKINDVTLQKRMAEVPKARAIIHTHIQEFEEWKNMRKNVPVLKAAKDKLLAMQSCTLFNHYFVQTNTSTTLNAETRIQKVINNMAQNMRKQNRGGCNFIEAINDFMMISAN